MGLVPSYQVMPEGTDMALIGLAPGVTAPMASEVSDLGPGEGEHQTSGGSGVGE